MDVDVPEEYTNNLYKTQIYNGNEEFDWSLNPLSEDIKLNYPNIGEYRQIDENQWIKDKPIVNAHVDLDGNFYILNMFGDKQYLSREQLISNFSPIFSDNNYVKWGNEVIKNDPIENITLTDMLAHGASGMVYNTNEQDQVAKLIPIGDFHPNEILEEEYQTEKQLFTPVGPVYKSRDIEFQHEVSALEKLSRKNLAPKLYKHGITNLIMNKDSQPESVPEVIPVGYLISEKFDHTLDNEMNLLAKDTVNKIKKISSKRDDLTDEEYKKVNAIVKGGFKRAYEIDKQIKNDEIEARNVGIINTDLHSENIMMKNGIPRIIDWGNTNQTKNFNEELDSEHIAIDSYNTHLRNKGFRDGDSEDFSTIRKYWKHKFSNR